MADLVVGSGPAGIAVALARLARGREVVLIDGGARLEDSAGERRRAFVTAAGGGGGAVAERRAWMAPQFAAPAGQQRRYGSDFAMRPAEASFASDSDPVGLRESHAEGGLSMLWGAALLPWRPEDIADWPVAHDDLARSWRALLAEVPVAGLPDPGLEARYPALPAEAVRALSPGPQVARLLARARRQAPRLSAMGAAVTSSRLAIGPGCRACGLCLHGCPWEEIWSARQSLARLSAEPRFGHRAGIVRRVSEDESGATAHFADGTSLRGERLFLAAGVLGTARIWLASGGAEALTVRDSSFAFLPSLQPGAPAPPAEVADNPTLAQAFVELDPTGPGDRSAHAQLYGWNEFYAPDLAATYGSRLPLSRPLLRRLARHLIVSQLFVHSDRSPAIALRLAAGDQLEARRVETPGATAAMDAALVRLARVLRAVGLVPLRFAARPAPVGASFHVGASLPMSAAPLQGGGGSDVLGRPRQSGRLHVVDASVLPAIPATTITFGVMGNAHRIGLDTPV